MIGLLPNQCSQVTVTCKNKQHKHRDALMLEEEMVQGELGM